MNKPDILLVMSDQHAAYYTGYESGIVDTPVLDELTAEGTRFANHYTSCPLCVPARMSFMTGRMPTKIGVTNNNMTIAETAPTFLFPLVAAGYETVLVGRMHFIGKDLRHGFTKRLGGDMTPTCWAPQWNAMGKERGKEFVSTFSSGGCLNTIGAGESPVRYYDDMVLEKALEYLSILHEKPQCIIVGTFGPHFPYVADKALYEKYKEREFLPANFTDDPDFIRNNPWLEAHRKDVDEETAKNAAAAYFALIEESDRKIGRVFDAFRNYAEKAGHTLIYGYTSDHGDMVGARKMYGKQTFFEESARVPLILAGNGIPKGKVVTANTSIMDIGPTLCELAGTRYEGRFVDGVSLLPLIKKDKSSNLRPVYSQYIESRGGGRNDPDGKIELSYGIMVRRGELKYAEYHGLEEEATLFNLEKDPFETTNVSGEHPYICEELHELAMLAEDPRIAEMEHLDRLQMHKWLQKYETEAGFCDEERWKDNPPSAKGQNVEF